MPMTHLGAIIGLVDQIKSEYEYEMGSTLNVLSTSVQSTGGGLEGRNEQELGVANV